MNVDEVKGLLAKVGIDKDGKEDNGKYIVDLGDSNAYSRAYTLLDNSELVDLDTESISMGVEYSSMTYLSDDYDITLKADFATNTYTIVVEEAKD